MLGKSKFYKIVLFLVKTITRKFWSCNFFLVPSCEETSFLTTFYGLYFSHHYTHIFAYIVYNNVDVRLFNQPNKNDTKCNKSAGG